MSDFRDVKDSGQRRESSTGSVRDRAEGKGRYDLITPIGLHRLAVHYENGARKYGDRNWERGQPVSWYIDSGIRHFFKYLAGKRDEDHLAAVAWNALGAIHTIEEVAAGRLPAEMDDVPVPTGVETALSAISDAIEAAEAATAIEEAIREGRTSCAFPTPGCHCAGCLATRAAHDVADADVTDLDPRATGGVVKAATTVLVGESFTERPPPDPECVAREVDLHSSPCPFPFRACICALEDD